jgi:hypothetical protein
MMASIKRYDNSVKPPKPETADPVAPTVSDILNPFQ